MTNEMKEKIALFCNVRKECVIQNLTADNLYAVPLMLEEEGLANVVCEHLHLEKKTPNNKAWENMIENIKNIGDETVKIAIVGKYVRLEDSYLSVAESLRHGGYANNVNVDIKYIDSETITEENAHEILKDVQGIVVPGGFGNRGIEGKIHAIKYVRENNIPFLGICLGMQMAVVEFIRNVCGLEDVDSEEFSPKCKNPVIHIMDTQKNVSKKGGTMRLRKLSMYTKGRKPC